MKVRLGFVSNSSSSSFLLINPKDKDIQLRGCKILELTKNQIKKMKKNTIKYIEKILKEYDWSEYRDKLDKIKSITEKDKVYLTNFVSDSLDQYLELSSVGIDYLDGGHGLPYDEEVLICLNPKEEEYLKVYIVK